MAYMYGRYNVSCVPIFSTHTTFSVLCTLAAILHEVHNCHIGVCMGIRLYM